MNILLSSAGRRVALAGCFRQSIAELSLHGSVVAVDAALESAAGQCADVFAQVPRCSHPGFLDAIHDICRSEAVDVVVPTIDPELPLYAAAKERFRQIGVSVCISDAETVEICSDKRLTHWWLEQRGFPVVRQSTPEEVLSDPDSWSLPLIAKPRRGSASVGMSRVESFSALELLASDSETIVEELAPGEEYTINVYVNRQGECVCAVPHRRLEVRSGEVAKGLTVKNTELMRLGADIAEALPGAYGPLNVQCFLAADGSIRVIEINPRFGGGYPLAHQAGAHMTTWILAEASGGAPIPPFSNWEDDLMMLRYDEAVYMKRKDLKAKANARPMCCV